MDQLQKSSMATECQRASKCWRRCFHARCQRRAARGRPSSWRGGHRRQGRRSPQAHSQRTRTRSRSTWAHRWQHRPRGGGSPGEVSCQAQVQGQKPAQYTGLKSPIEARKALRQQGQQVSERARHGAWPAGAWEKNWFGKFGFL
eukprot:3651368-Amphidinium_carterae.1